MKLIRLFIPLLLIMMVFNACKKENLSAPSVPSLTASKTSNIGQGEPVSFTLPNVAAGTLAKWIISPSLNTRLTAGGGGTATILFDKKGEYNVTATYGIYTSSRIISVSDTVYSLDSAAYTTVALIGDQITLTPSILSSQSDGSLIITATTKNKYNCLNNFISIHIKDSLNAYAVSFNGVSNTTYNCTAGQMISTSSFYLMSATDGKYALSMSLNGITYSGSYIKKGSSYIFTWPYTSGVLLSPLSISK